MLNYLYGDLAMMMFRPAAYQQVIGKMSEAGVLGATALMELSIVMVLLARVLNCRANRWANVIVGTVFSLFAFITLLPGRPAAFYVFLSLVEIAATVFIVWYAWTWPDPARGRAAGASPP